MTAALAGLVVVAGVALQGRVPGVAPTAAREDAVDSPLAFAMTLLLLGSSVVIMAVSLVIAARRPRRPADPVVRELPDGLADPWRRPRLRTLLAVAAAVALVALLVGLIGRIDVTSPPAPPPAAPAASSAVPSARPAPPPKPPKPPGRDMSGYLVATTAVLVLMAAAGSVLARRRPADPAVPAPPPAADTPEVSPLTVAAERGLAAVEDHSREPREAIIACYAAMEQALAGTGAAPLASDTPSEVLARAVDARALRPESATTLVELFAEARFSRHEMTETHRGIAEQALRSVLDDMSAADTRATT